MKSVEARGQGNERLSESGVSQRRHSGLIVPRHPRGGSVAEFVGILSQSGQIVEGIDARQTAGVDQTHEQIAHVRAFFGFVEEGIGAVPDRHFQRSFAQIIVKGSSGHTQEERQGFPMFKLIAQGLAEITVRFHLLGFELPFHPLFERPHQGPADALMQGQSLFRR